jgi:hypothetical protein
MKRSIFLFLLCLFVISFTYQSQAQLIKGYGLKIGLTSADQKLKYSSFTGDTKRRIGFNVGGYVEWLDIPFFSVLTEVEYVQRGMGQEFTITTEDSPEGIGKKTLYTRLDYISIPVLAKATLPGTIISPYIVAGPRLDILLGYKSDENAFNDLYGKFKKNIFGGTVGLGAETGSVLPVTLTADVRYNFDFTKSFKNEYLEVSNNAFDFMVGIRF